MPFYYIGQHWTICFVKLYHLHLIVNLILFCMLNYIGLLTLKGSHPTDYCFTKTSVRYISLSLTLFLLLRRFSLRKISQARFINSQKGSFFMGFKPQIYFVNSGFLPLRKRYLIFFFGRVSRHALSPPTREFFMGFKPHFAKQKTFLLIYALSIFS